MTSDTLYCSSEMEYHKELYRLTFNSARVADKQTTTGKHFLL